VGKTTIGKAVARRLGRQFLDFDQEIERRSGMEVREIFRLRGEEHFRELEFALTKELSVAGGMVLSPGGGWIAQQRSVELLRSVGRIIYLRASPEAVARRLRRVETRPLLAGRDPVVALRELYQKRQAMYETADTVLDTERLARQQLIAKIVELASTMT
jgi:shikimate kinase